MTEEVEVFEEDESGPVPAVGAAAEGPEVEKYCRRCDVIVTHKYRVKIGKRYYCRDCYRFMRTKKKLRLQIRKLTRPFLIGIFLAVLAYYVYRFLEKEGAAVINQATESTGP